MDLETTTGIELTKENFEDCIEVGLKLSEIYKYFGKTYAELNEFVRANYNGLQLEYVYDRIRQKSYKEYVELLKLLALRGNATALQTLNQFIYDFKEEDKVQKVQILAGVPDNEN